MGNGESALQSGTKIESNIKVTWKELVTCPYEPREGQSTAVWDSKLYLFGGVLCRSSATEHSQERQAQGNVSNQLLAFNIEELRWEEIKATGQIPEPRSGSAMSAVDGKLYMFGGLSEFSGWLNDLHVFDISTSTWVKVDNAAGLCPSPRDKLTSAVVAKDVYFFGGFGPGDDDEPALEDIPEDDGDEEYEDEEIAEMEQMQNAARFTWFNTLYRFDTENKCWGKIDPIIAVGDREIICPTPRAAHTMCAIGQSLFIIGGRDSVGRKNDIWEVSVPEGRWRELVPMGCRPVPRSFHAATAIGKRIVMCGGRSITNEHLRDFHIYDTANNMWLQPEVTGAAPPAVGMHSLAAVRNSVVLCGGTSELDPVTNSCSKYHTECYAIATEEVLNGGPISLQESEQKAVPEKADTQQLPAFLNLKPKDQSN